MTDFRETSPALTQGVDRATGLLSLICLVAMVLGAIGVAMAMRAHLQQRIEILAIMKSIGAQVVGHFADLFDTDAVPWDVRAR